MHESLGRTPVSVQDEVIKSGREHTVESNRNPLHLLDHPVEKNLAKERHDAVQQRVEAMAVTNEKLMTSLAKLGLPKCHPDIFS